MTGLPTPRVGAPSAFVRPSPVPEKAERLGLADIDLESLNEIRLLLRGDSVVDWHRLGLRDAEEVRRLLALNALDIRDPEDVRRIESLRADAARYIRESLNLRLDEDVVSKLPIVDVFLLASSPSGKNQRHACTLLKVMHILYHLDARELLTALSLPVNELFSRIEESVARMFDELRQAGVPVGEFAWSRKTRDSLITKLLVKKETSAARVFDRLRFRLVVDDVDDIVPTLHVLLHRCIPFNYVVPGQTVNSLIDTAELDRVIGERELVVPSEDLGDGLPVTNEFSSRGYKALNFVADLPVRIDGFVSEADKPILAKRGRVVFVLAEFQILDAATARANEKGDSAHAQYKQRQHQSVRERLLREPKSNTSHRSNGSRASDSDK